jgi:site-specific recombinase
VFVVEATNYLRRFAGRVAASVAVGMLCSTALSVVLTLGNPPGMRHVAIGVGSNEVFMLLFAGMVWLMAAVIGQGQSLAEENESFV